MNNYERVGRLRRVREIAEILEGCDPDTMRDPRPDDPVEGALVWYRRRAREAIEHLDAISKSTDRNPISTTDAMHLPVGEEISLR